jgi:dipeptidyl aminopeptidase/acylaminoacyl peptidase
MQAAAAARSVRDTRRIGFFRRDATTGDLSPWGAVVDIDEGTFGGVWSPDGRFFYVNNVRAGARPIDLTPDPSTLGDYVGTVQVIQVARVAGDAARHRVIQEENTPIFPEGIAVSPDGSLLATVNQQTSALPPSTPLFSPTSTISLWTRNKATGRLHKARDTSSKGSFPKAPASTPRPNS